MSYEKDIERGIELLKLCQQLQSEKDGVVRPEPGAYDRTKALDEFACDIDQTITYLAALHRLMPLATQLSQLGRELERQDKIKVSAADDYAAMAINFLLKEYGIEDKLACKPMAK